MAALDELLDDQLVASGPDGSSTITEPVEEHLDVLVAETTGVTFFVGTVSGAFDGRPMTARLRYTRTWVRDSQGLWRIPAAHIAVVVPDA